jgi:hypothetical protein
MTEEIWHNNSRGWYEEETDGMTTTTSQRRKEKEGMRGKEGGEGEHRGWQAAQG